MKTKETAAQAYQRNQDDVGALLDLVGQEMAHHHEYAKTEGIHFGHAGDLAALRKTLIEALAQLAQQDEAFITRHLDEMREERRK
jgi:hypothetical protein